MLDHDVGRAPWWHAFRMEQVGRIFLASLAGTSIGVLAALAAVHFGGSLGGIALMLALLVALQWQPWAP